LTAGFDGITHLPRLAIACEELLLDVDAVARLVAKYNLYQDHFIGPVFGAGEHWGRLGWKGSHHKR
jgi:hypothetical protein